MVALVGFDKGGYIKKANYMLEQGGTYKNITSDPTKSRRIY